LAGGGDVSCGFVEGAGRRVDFSHYCVGLRHGVEATGVGRGELEAVEEGAAVLEVDLVGGDGVDDLRDGDLDGDAVLEGAEVEDGAAAFEVGSGEHGRAVDAVRVVEAAVEVTEDGMLEGNGLALEPVRTDVAAEFDLHA
jgi:hypothetical protein